MGPDAAAGLRERKKRATRHALSAAALQLAVERGLSDVRIDDIARIANVSPRTFNNYFSSKEQAIVWIGVDRAESIADALRERPPSEPLATALTRVFVDEYRRAAGVDEHWLARIRLIVGSPALHDAYLASRAGVEHALTVAIAERTGAEMERDLGPAVIAAAVSNAERVAIEYWLRSGATNGLPELVAQAIAHVVSTPPRPRRSRVCATPPARTRAAR